MDRRNLLKAMTFGLAGGAVATVQTPVKAQSFKGVLRYQPDAKAIADTVENFLTEARKTCSYFPGGKTLSLPFASTPLSLYVRTTAAIDKIPLSGLADLRNGLRDQGNEFALSMMKGTLRELWDRWRPYYYHELVNYPTKHEAVRGNEGFPIALPSRVITPRYTIDLAELDERRLATILSLPKLLAEELENMTRTAYQAALGSVTFIGPATFEGDGWTGPLETYVKRDGFMLEVFCSVVAAGHLYTVNTPRYSVAEHANWLAARRREPTHWAILPFPVKLWII
jgi:hypothetical protein